ncbi:MAG: HDIG domain-containing protein, partial [Clostridia bacterium]|nr:HDIG domain-containing protein [Clostridia bacterium]
ERYDLRAGDIAKKTITASKDVVDEVTTRQRQEAAANQVHVVSYKNETVAGEVIRSLYAAGNELRAVRQFGQDIRERRDEAQREEGQRDGGLYTEQELQTAAALVPSVAMTNEQLRVLMDMPAEALESLCQTLIASARTALDASILEGEVDKAISGMQLLVTQNTSALHWANIGRPTLEAHLQPNMLVDQESTEANRQRAREEVEPTVYKQGQNIVVAGERVTAAQLAMLNALGLIQGTRYDTELYVGIGLLVSLLMGGLYLYLLLFVPEILGSVAKQALMLLILGLGLGLCAGFQQLMPQVLPVTMGALLVAILLGTRAALGVNLVLSLLVGLLAIRGNVAESPQTMAVLVMGMLGGLVGIWAVRKRAPRSKVLLSGVLIGLTYALTLFSAGMVTNNDLRVVSTLALYAMLAGVISAVLCVGIQPALEVMFNLVTPAKLMELSNPNQPLLRRLMIEAPGTYHHSMVVANIAEAAAETIGANPLLARVGAYYHDIGKLKRPGFFKENQSGDNPHDRVDPRVSTAIILAHVRDGVALGERYRLPPQVLDIIAQHHGDTPVLFFYNKALHIKGGEEAPVDIKDFRYEGPRPRTAEAALVMLADTAEAAVRSIQDPTFEKVESTIRTLVKGKLEDNQLNDTPLTFRDLDYICNAFIKVLGGVFHERIEYPALEAPDLTAEEESAMELAEEE